MNIYIELLLLATLVVYIVDLSGWTETWLSWLSRFTSRYGRGPVRELRPFSCSLCMVWWCCLAWLLYRHAFTIPLIAYSAGLSFFSNTIQNLCISIREALLTLTTMMTRWMERD